MMSWWNRPSQFPLLLVLLFVIMLATYVWQQISPYVDLGPEVQMKETVKYPEFKPHYEELEKMTQQKPVVNISGILPPFHRFEQAILVTPKYNLATCQIEKIMSTVRDGIFCYLTNTTEFLAHNRTISTEYWTTRFCGNQFLYYDLDKAMEDYNHNLTLFSVIRHPIDRFLSGYVDKCINEKHYFKKEKRCFGCKEDIRCFVERLHKNLFEYYTNTTKNSSITYYYVRHFAPQTWYCNFKDHKNDYILVDYHTGPKGIEMTAKEFDKIFEQVQVPADMRAVIQSEMLSKSCPLRISRSSKNIANYLQLLDRHRPLA
ncbi:hypothetical protein ANCCAN_25122 [Ancylostoma caninum]|uniref:Carbohydrate sulfotransferase n=1 Tax=Ancylostoma caninum TaxID=29170 RepID=A0A368FAA7_ANCCA|nr:hypothetical protein ANCCAN_25122 [Ancylostoma caninum]